MDRKKALLLSITAFISISFAFLVINPSYQKSIKAKFLLFNKRYEEAFLVAKESLILDPYNKMAISVLNRAGSEIEYIRYIEQSKEYMNKIVAIANSKTITKADRLRLKQMCKYMIERYDILKNSKQASKELQEEAHSHFLKFKEIYEEVF